MNTITQITIAIAMLASVASASADERQAALTRHNARESAFLTVHGETKAPIGYVQYCQERSWECRNTTAEPKDVDMTRARMAELDYVNRWVNKSIEAISDLDHYGVAEYWTIPSNGKGDCEDYALLKRKMLMERGWPESALLMTVVRDQKGDGHAVLTVRTNEGDVVLDNVNDQIITWHNTGYRFVKRQSQWNPTQWVSLGTSINPNQPIASQRR